MVAVSRIVFIPLIIATHAAALWLGIRHARPEAAWIRESRSGAMASVPAIGSQAENETRGRSNLVERDPVRHQDIGPDDDLESILFRAMEADRDMDLAIAAMKAWLDRDSPSALHRLGCIHRCVGSSRLQEALAGRYAGGKWDLLVEDFQSAPVAREVLLSVAAEECKKMGDPRAVYHLAAMLVGQGDRFELLAEAVDQEGLYANLPETRRLLGEPGFSFLLLRQEVFKGMPEDEVAIKVGKLRAAGVREYFIQRLEEQPIRPVPDASDDSTDPFSSRTPGPPRELMKEPSVDGEGDWE